MKPILVIQMQRMGDLILTFPLLLWLERHYPGRGIVVVAEPRFYKDLASIGPTVTYVSHADRGWLESRAFSLVINLSHRRESAWIAGNVRAEEKIGPMLDPDGNMYINGDWQLYRASLVDNNRHNTFHWADLNALDAIPPNLLRATSWQRPRRLPSNNPKVGIFLGASQAEKKPGHLFWADLAKGLITKGIRPVLLGGPGERACGRSVATGLDVPVLDLSGRTTLQELARIGQSLQLMITPDTGPMHLAAWTGLRTLNLSMGPVNPWETGPYQTDHYVLKTSMSCAGCWSCRFDRPRCADGFTAPKVVRIVLEIMRGREANLEKMVLPGMELLRTSRRDGFYWLDPLHTRGHSPSCRALLDLFWHSFWKWYFGLGPEQEICRDAAGLLAAFPRVAATMQKTLVGLCRDLRGQSPPRGTLDYACGDRLTIPALSPCLCFGRLVLENGNFSRRSFLRVLSLFDRILSLLSPSFFSH
ncbi:glycosyltransferase family 9 protein [Desulfoplanes sp.]